MRPSAATASAASVSVQSNRKRSFRQAKCARRAPPPAARLGPGRGAVARPAAALARRRPAARARARVLGGPAARHGLEVVVDDLHRHRRRDLAAVAAVLDQDRERDARAARRREADEPGVVVLVVRRPPRRGGAAPHLRGAGLARHLDLRRARLVGRPLGLVDHADQALANDGQVLGRHRRARAARGARTLPAPVRRATRPAPRSAAATACRRWRWPRTASPSAAASRASSPGR